jgi:signal transduction histidine kinase
MTFRWRVSLFFVLLLVVSLLLQFGLGFVLFKRALLRDLQSDLLRHTTLLSNHINFTSNGVALDGEGLDDLGSLNSYADGRARVVNAANQQSYALGAVFPEDSSAWLSKRITLGNGYTLELAMNPQVHNSALRSYLQASGIGLPLLTVLLVALTLALSQRLIRPLHKLQEVVTQVSNSVDLTMRVPELTTNDELGQLSKSYNQMMTRLEQFFERERSFSRNASHELRNPLTALRVQVDSALAGDTPAEKVLPILKQELRRLSAILDGLLILSRDQHISGAVVDLALVLKESVDRARVLAEDKSLVIDYHGPNSVTFKGDKALLSRMVDNLLDNAIKYSNSDQVILELVVTVSYIEVRVSDYGVGVPIDTLKKLTTPFFRVKQKQGSGVGLGLSVVQQIVEAHSGTLSFENLNPVGFAATIHFPKFTA